MPAIIFLLVGIVSTVIILGLLGKSLLSSHGNPPGKPSLFSLKSQVAFAFGLGWSGLILNSTEIPFAAVLICAVLFGAAAFFAAYFLTCILAILSRKKDRKSARNSNE